MSKRYKSKNPQVPRPPQKARQTRRRRRPSGGLNPLVWVGGVLAIVVVLIGFNLFQLGTFAKSPTPSRSQEPSNLLPLAEAELPLKGGHDMAAIPKQTPAPQPAPEGVALPSLDLPATSHNFGLIPKKSDVAHIFAVQNTGTADLKIWNLVTSCGCTIAELTSSVIAPGQRADLTVTFDPDFHMTQGEVVRLVWFATNDPSQPWAQLRITADVR